MGDKMQRINLQEVNIELRHKTPKEIIEWALSISNKPILTTNFRPYDVAIINACNQVDENLKVIWCDTGYNTPNTYKHANFLLKKFKLNIEIYVPKQTSSYTDVTIGIPSVDDTKHKEFSEIVKLEPFKRAFEEHNPDLWFTNLRQGQTTFRDSIDIVSLNKDGVIKVSPFYYWKDKDLDKYLEENKLPNEFKYFDPTKALENRECGIHS